MILTTIVTLYVSAQNKTYVPDDVFENYLETHNSEGKVVPLGDSTSMGDGIANNDSVATANIHSVTSLVLTGMLPNIIRSLEGIQDFTALEELRCMSHNIPSLNLSSNTALKKLSCIGMQLTSLTVSSNLQLETLNCESNKGLTSIDLSQNKKLTEFTATGNSFQSIDFSQNALLKTIRIAKNQLSNIDVSAQKDLAYLDISENDITQIDLSNNQELKQFTCYNTQIQKLTFENNPKLQYLYCSGSPIDSLDLSGNHLLDLFQCQNTPISYLNVKNGNNASFSNHTFSVRFCPNLTCVTVDDAEWSTLVWENIDPQTSFSSNCGGTPEEPDTIVVPEGKTYIQDTQFESYLETHNSNGAVVSLGDPTSMGDGIENNNLVLTANIRSVTTLDISGGQTDKIRRLKGIEDFTDLRDLNCSNNGLFSLDLSSNPSLENLDCSSNSLVSVNVSSNANLKSLRCENNQGLTTIDVSNNPQLIEFSCFSSSLSSLDFSKNTLIERIEASMNQLSDLNVSGAINLKTLHCNGNMNLTTIDLSTNKALTELMASHNRIATLDVSQNELLEKIEVSNNQLSSFDLSANKALTYCDISNNAISDIDLTNNPELDYFLCHYNQIKKLSFKNNPKLSYLYCTGNPIELLDLSSNHLLDLLTCNDTPISYLDVRNGNNTSFKNGTFSVKNSPNLTCIAVDDANWSTANLRNIDSHTSFSNDCGGMPIDTTIVNASKTYIPDDIFENYLETHDATGQVVPLGDVTSMGDGIANNDSVTTANISSVQFLYLDGLYPIRINSLEGIQDFSELRDLRLGGNNLSSLDISANAYLEFLDCSSNQLSSLNVSSNSKLKLLRCDGNRNLTSIDLSNNKELTDFQGSFNEFTTLDFSKNTLLETIEVAFNRLTNIDVSANKALTVLEISNNEISDIDLTNNPELDYFLCSHNQIKKFSFKNNPKLGYLYCTGNPIDSLDLSSNHLLDLLNCRDTPISYLDIRNGNNTSFKNGTFTVKDSPNLTCVSVDDADWSTANWKNIDPHTSFSNDCDANICHDTVHVTVYDTIHVTVYDTIRVAVYDSITVTDTLVINIEKSATGVPNNESTIKIYPNPANDLVYINTGDDYQNLMDYKLKMVNTLGQTVFESFINSQIITVHVNTIGKKGLYYVHISDREGQVIHVRKIIFQ